jgi:hypothetical protein
MDLEFFHKEGVYHLLHVHFMSEGLELLAEGLELFVELLLGGLVVLVFGLFLFDPAPFLL